ncbi:hypothetical protein SERLA73DRAFT_174140 [Serpula lacrymans var. lacrymans S7.3]|uniref:WW domain-containing protein n=2 Tax=Serpula lacrymans var. lacrymans TaxID=341189 RepID=F8PID1_SERL3|nr:uncharacterized protein SERLADRAFT_444484 [Serpula lacrymans var. lacrymans S7.9]EGO05174.1 hypothetical protein SERLA73DRAFT_174140 [Serpula lacrymans var. lacrymans S7.3]EGO30914.1 hypothetical protein SERLADRAFT_444484 [Serpula lacrymans var. lacrymans S7.9]
MSNLPLPNGWIQEYDSTHNHPFWVDTTTDPPRAIWVHPYEDEQFLSENPEIKKKVTGRFKRTVDTDTDEPPPYEQVRRHSYSGDVSSSVPKRRDSVSPEIPSVENVNNEHKRGVFGRLKDKAIGTKEEREAERKRKAEERAQLEEQYRQARIQNLQARQTSRANYGQYDGYGYPGRMGGYGPPMGSPYGYDGYSRSAFGGRGMGMGGSGMGMRGGMGGGMAMPLLGGLAGGLLLGDLLDGGFGGGGFGGGGFDGGMGGGGFF